MGYGDSSLSYPFANYFNQLHAAEVALALPDLENRISEFQASSDARAQDLTAYEAGLSALYRGELEKRAALTASALIRTCQRFPDETRTASSSDLVDLASSALDALERVAWNDSGCIKHKESALHQRFFDLAAATGSYSTRKMVDSLRAQGDKVMKAIITRAALDHLRSVREGSAKGRRRPSLTINGPFHGTVLTGDASVANVSNIGYIAAAPDLINAIREIRVVFGEDRTLDNALRQELITDTQRIEDELRGPEPNQPKLLKLLGGLGSVVQTLGSAPGAWEVVRAAARACGLPL